MVWPALCLRHRNKTQHILLVFQKSCEHTSQKCKKRGVRERKHFWRDVLSPSCSLFLFSSFGFCLKIILLHLVWSTRCVGRLTQTEMENDGNNRQPRARGLCSIDPIALIKVVYREYTLFNDGWLLIIMQQPRNITPLICGVLTQSLRAILAWLTPQRRTEKVPSTSWSSARCVFERWNGGKI